MGNQWRFIIVFRLLVPAAPRRTATTATGGAASITTANTVNNATYDRNENNCNDDDRNNDRPSETRKDQYMVIGYLAQPALFFRLTYLQYDLSIHLSQLVNVASVEARSRAKSAMWAAPILSEGMMYTARSARTAEHFRGINNDCIAENFFPCDASKRETK